jgi:hypothetical protein
MSSGKCSSLFFVFMYCSRRRALHRHDPLDLQRSFAAAAEEAAAATPNKEQPQSVQDLELAQAKSTGLLVDISPTSVVNNNNHGRNEMDELDQWDKARGRDEFMCSDNDESDDDLL